MFLVHLVMLIVRGVCTKWWIYLQYHVLSLILHIVCCFSPSLSLRALYGTSLQKNATHGSANPEDAKRELAIMFPELRCARDPLSYSVGLVPVHACRSMLSAV